MKTTKAKPRGKSWVKGQSGNPAGRPRDGESWAAIIKAVGDMYPTDILAFIGEGNDLGRALKQYPPNVQMKYLVTARVFAALMFEPASGLWRELMERVEGKARNAEENNQESSVAPFHLPAELISPSFLSAYRDIKDARHTEYLFYGGRGSTKSSFVSLAVIYLLISNPTIHAVAMRHVKETLRDSVYSQLLWAIGELGIADAFHCTVSPLEMEYIPTKQKIFFRGADDPNKIKSIKPSFGHIGLLWFEELDQFHGQESVRKIEQSVIRGGDTAWIFKSFNPPPTQNNWANKYLTIPKDTQYQHRSDYLNVPVEWLGKAFIDEAEHLKSVNPKAYEHEYMGVANSDGGLVFTNVRVERISDEQIAQFDNVLHGLDWGFYPDPAHYSRVHFDAARRILYVFGELRGYKMSNEQLYKDIVAYGYNPESILIADSAEPKSVMDFRSYGAQCRGAEKGEGSVRYGIKWLQGLTAIIIDNVRAPYSVEEFTEYEFERTKDGEIISAYPDNNNHAIDSIRYATNLIWRRKGE